MIDQSEVLKIDDLLLSRTYWRHYDASTYLRNDLYAEFIKSKDKPATLKRIWAINMGQKWGCDPEELWSKCVDRCPIFDTPLDYGLGKNTLVRNNSGENNDWFRPSADHVVARSHGGSSNDVSNIVVVSLRANTLKNNIKSEEELTALFEGIKRVYFS